MKTIYYIKYRQKAFLTNENINNYGGGKISMDSIKTVSKENDIKDVQKISLSEKIAYGGGDLASNLILVLTSTFITFFYTDALGLNPAIIGTIMMFSRFGDGVTNILMGYVVDKTKSKYGKARPWLLWIAIPIAIATVLVFLVPNTSNFGKYVYVTISYNLVTTFLYTMINIPYGALTSFMSRDQDQRMIINAFRMFMAQIGSLIINAGTLPFVNSLWGSSNQKSWVVVACIYGIIAAILFLICFGKTKERVVVSTKQKESVSLGKSLTLIIKNKYWLLLAGVWVFSIFGGTLSGSVSTYYAKYVLRNEDVSGYLNAISILPVLILMPFLAQFNRKFGKRNVALIGSILGIGAQLLLLVNPASSAWLLFCSVIKGISGATMIATIFAMIADTIEYGEWKNKIRVEGILYSSTTFGAQLGAGVGSALALSIIGHAGYVGMAAVQTASAISSIKALYLYAPIPFLIVIPFLYKAYKLDKIYPQVMSDLKERESNE